MDANREDAAQDPLTRPPDSGPSASPQGVSAVDVAGDVVAGGQDGQHAVGASLPPFATHNVLVSLPDTDAARALVVALEGANVESSRISYLALVRDGVATEPGGDGPPADGVMTNEERIHSDTEAARTVGAGAAQGAAAGAVGGAVLGAALMLIPGVGTLAGAGILAAVLGGAAGGGNLGLVWGAFRRMGVSPAWEHTFATVEAGEVLVGVHTDDEAEWSRALARLPDSGRHYFDHDGKPIRERSALAE